MRTLSPPIAAPLPGAAVSFAVIGSPASVVAVTCSGESFASTAFSSRVAGASTRAYAGSPKRAGQLRVVLAGGPPGDAR